MYNKIIILLLDVNLNLGTMKCCKLCLFDIQNIRKFQNNQIHRKWIYIKTMMMLFDVNLNLSIMKNCKFFILDIQNIQKFQKNSFSYS